MEVWEACQNIGIGGVMRSLTRINIVDVENLGGYQSSSFIFTRR